MSQSNDAETLATGGGRLSRTQFWLSFLALYLLTALPIIRADLPPLVDYPNHLARMHVLIELPRSEALQQYYEIRWAPLPNLAMDLTVPLLARVMPLEWAAKVFILILLVLLPAGAALIHRVAARQWSVWPLFAFVFLYSHLLVGGYLNYLFGLGLALVAFALWLALAKQALALRVGLASASALVLFFAHLMACALFAMLIAGHEIDRLWRDRELSGRRILTEAIASGLPFVAPAALLFGNRFGGELSGFAYEGILRKLSLVPMFDRHLILDIATAAALGLLVTIGFFKRFVTVVPSLRIPLLIVALAFILAPTRLATAYNIEDRFPLVFALLLTAGIVSTKVTTKNARLVVLVGIAVFLARIAAFAADSERANQIYPRLIAILDQIPRGGRLAVAFRSNEIGPSAIPVNHVPTLAVLRRDAFVPTFFAFAGQQPITLMPAARRLQNAAEPGALWAALMAGENGDEQLRVALEGYDALVAMDPRPFVVPAHALLVPVGVEPNFALYRVVH